MFTVSGSVLSGVEHVFVTQLTPWDLTKYAVTRKGPWPSELFLLIALAAQAQVTRWIESGTCWGQSMEMLWRGTADLRELVTIEKDPALEKAIRWRIDAISGRGRIRLMVGDGCDAVVTALDEAPEERTAVFLDGPKSVTAVELALAALQRPGVQFVAMHDMYPSTLGHANPGRERLDRLGGWASDDPEWVQRFGYLDAGRHAEHLAEDGSGWLPWLKIYRGRTEYRRMPCYGPTVGVLLR